MTNTPGTIQNVKDDCVMVMSGGGASKTAVAQPKAGPLQSRAWGKPEGQAKDTETNTQAAKERTESDRCKRSMK